jgi:hypothetical protein
MFNQIKESKYTYLALAIVLGFALAYAQENWFKK